QNAIAAARGSIPDPFSVDPLGGESDEKDDDLAGRIRNPRALQMVNRVFVVRQGTPGAVSLLAAGAWKVTPASQTRRRNEGLASVRREIGRASCREREEIPGDDVAGKNHEAL